MQVGDFKYDRIMKKYIFLAFAAVAVIACGKKDPVFSDLTLSQTEISAEADGSTVSIDVTCADNWAASTKADWITVDPASGSGNATVTVTVAKNEATSAREDVLYFNAPAHRRSVKVVQAAAKAPDGPDVPPTPTKVLSIKSAEDFAAFAASEYAADETVTLDADITIKAPADQLLCSFDGKNHTITLELETTETISDVDPMFAHVGVFRMVYGAVKDLKVAGTLTHSAEAGSGTYHIGGVAGYAAETASFDNCESSMEIVATTKCTHHIGGIIGYSAPGVTVNNCHNKGPVGMIIPAKGAANASQVGGIIGHLEANGVVSSCTNSGKVTYEGTGTPRMGGITGYVNNLVDVTFKDCVNDGTVEWNEGDYTASSWSYVGGITGYFGTPTDGSKVLYENCVNNGNIKCNVTDAKTKTRCGGIAGHAGRSNSDDGLFTYTYKNCTNNGEVSATSTTGNNHIGGILGYSEVSAKIVCDGCTNNGRVYSAGNGAVGGILGMRCSKSSLFTNITVSSKSSVEGGATSKLGIAFGNVAELETAVTGKVAGQIAKGGEVTVITAENFAGLIVGNGESVDLSGVTFGN